MIRLSTDWMVSLLVYMISNQVRSIGLYLGLPGLSRMELQSLIAKSRNQGVHDRPHLGTSHEHFLLKL